MSEQETAYVAVDGSAYYRKSPLDTWRLLGADYHAHGDEIHTDNWEHIDGIVCEVFRLSGGGMIAQPTKLCEVVLEPEIAEEPVVEVAGSEAA
jgi:hypothetical protein